MTATLARLDAEWADLAPPGRGIPAAWQLACPALRGVSSLRAVPDAVRAAPDEVLLALLRLHASGDPLAGRTVMQVMLPKAVRLALVDGDASLDDHLAALWERICSYPVGRRPTRVAANLALDTLKAVKAGHRTPPPPTLPPPEPERVAGATVLDAGARLGVIDDATRRTLEVVYLHGRSSREAAAVLGTSADSVRWRCSRGVRALRAHAPALVAELAG